MLKWIADNYTWIFSGVGVTALLLLFGLFRWKKRTPQNAHPSLAVSVADGQLLASPIAGRDVIQTVHITNPIQSDGSTTSEFKATPTAKEIYAQVDAVPVYQRSAARESYTGLKVRWPAKFQTLQETKDPNVVRIFVRCGNEYLNSPLVAGELDIRRYPRLKIIYPGEPVVIAGTINNVGEIGIYIDLDQLEFLEK